MVRVRTPNGIRTRAAALKGRCPGPLDDGGRAVRRTPLDLAPVAPAVGGPGEHRGRCAEVTTVFAACAARAPWRGGGGPRPPAPRRGGAAGGGGGGGGAPPPRPRWAPYKKRLLG